MRRWVRLTWAARILRNVDPQSLAGHPRRSGRPGAGLSGHADSVHGAELMAILPTIEASKLQSLTNADPTVQAIQITKQFAAASNNGLVPSDFPSGSALHTGLGVQRQIARDFVLSADIVYRHFIHTIRWAPLVST